MLPKAFGGVWGLDLETCTLATCIQTKICHFPCPISDLREKLLPLIRFLKLEHGFTIGSQKPKLLKTIPFGAVHNDRAHIRE